MISFMRVKRIARMSVASLALPGLAVAHPGHVGGVPFTAGLLHPMGGLDHMLAMVVLGLIAAQMGGRALWALPATFIGAALVGGATGQLGYPGLAVEPMILASIVVMGGLVMIAARMPMVSMLPMAAIFGLAHGWAHGIEAPTAGFVTYAAGFGLTTLALHLAGILTGQIFLKSRILRGLGAVVAVSGMALGFVS
ncbi:HupE/UreJ family protein [Falsirhodobacter sp. alg1]|uniref:HupE/UreJ family protein n=1 Tax=Falsirhodobacter sp. alg1 TaxID=1472418 RepID=UPI0005EEF247|nr:HupE/UreJ family protein [Falsirhodobacter sp. alg1]